MDRISMPATQNNTTSLESEEVVEDKDEPPDQEGSQTPRQLNARVSTSDNSSYSRITSPPPTVRKLSLLSQAIHSESETSKSDVYPLKSTGQYRNSTKSSWSHGSTASNADLSSDNSQISYATRDSSPSPPLPPATFTGLPPVFNKDPFGQSVNIRRNDEDDHIGPLQKATIPESEPAVELQLGRRRCISFACGRKESLPAAPKSRQPSPPPPQAPQQPKRTSIRFSCPSKVPDKTPDKDAAAPKPRAQRRASPAPRAAETIKALRTSQRSHRGSDATVRNDSPKAQRKLSYIQRHARRPSTSSDLGRSEATRFHEFASSEEEVDEWVQEATVHRSRLTVDDTLKVEKGLRQLGEEVEEEVNEEEEAELDEDSEDDAEEDDDEDNDDDDEAIDDEDEDKEQEVEIAVEDGWSTDDEQGFAGSESDSDADSDCQWWAPAKSTTATSMDKFPEHIRPHGQRSMSNQSVSSTDSALAAEKSTPPPRHHRRRRSKPMAIRPRSSELPDSTDFVCGTLDEDRPLEDAYLSCLERRRAAKHKATPQDIDPTFPTSDPELDDEKDEDEPISARLDESDQHPFFCGSLENFDGAELRGRPKRSPAPSPKRLHSPVPPKRKSLRSPPPRRLRSPPPAGHLRAPPPSRQPSDYILHKSNPASAHVAALAGERQPTISTSLPEEAITPITPSTGLSDPDEDEATDNLPTRGAIDIKEGLERKRARRREKLYQKHCRRKEGEKDKPVPPGKGCQRMREIGVELAAYCRGLRPAEVIAPDDKVTEALILSI